MNNKCSLSICIPTSGLAVTDVRRLKSLRYGFKHRDPCYCITRLLKEKLYLWFYRLGCEALWSYMWLLQGVCWKSHVSRNLGTTCMILLKMCVCMCTYIYTRIFVVVEISNLKLGTLSLPVCLSICEHIYNWILRIKIVPSID